MSGTVKHVGVLGMKWGRRKGSSKTGSRRRSKKPKLSTKEKAKAYVEKFKKMSLKRKAGEVGRFGVIAAVNILAAYSIYRNVSFIARAFGIGTNLPSGRDVFNKMRGQPYRYHGRTVIDGKVVG